MSNILMPILFIILIVFCIRSLTLPEANEAIERINEMKNLTARHRDNVLGECYFLKAWAYFMLVSDFTNVF